MELDVIDHPLVEHKLTLLRDERTTSLEFRRLTEELVTLLAYEATRDIGVETVRIRTPLQETKGVRVAPPLPLVVPILRAGLGMLDGMTRLLPMAEVGFLGMARDEETLRPTTYTTRLPEDLADRHVYVLDPMLATGGTLAAALRFLHNRNAAGVTVICLLASPEGISLLEEQVALADLPVRVVTGALDERLDEHGFIVPGLGDAGDRLFGTDPQPPASPL